MGTGSSRRKKGGGSEAESAKRKLLLKTLEGHTGGINCMDISSSGSYLLTGSDDRTARIWDLATYENKVVLEGHTGYVSCCKIWRDRFALTGSMDKTLRKWNILSGNCVLKMELHRGIINSLLPYGSYVFTTSYDRTVICWSVENGLASRVFRGHKQSILPILYVNTADHDPRGAEEIDRNKDALITGSMDCTAKIWSINSGTSLRTFRGHKGAILCLTMDKDKKHLYTGSTDYSIKKWNVANGNLLKNFKGHEGSVICLEINHKLLYSASVDCTARCWVAEFGDTTRKYSGHEHMISDMKYHYGLLITSSGDNTVRVFDAKSGSLKRTFKGHKYAVNRILSVDNMVLSASYDGTVKFWSIRDLVKEKLSTLDAPESCSSLTSTDSPSATDIAGINDNSVKCGDDAFNRSQFSRTQIRSSDNNLNDNAFIESQKEAQTASAFKIEKEGSNLTTRNDNSSRQKRRGGKQANNKVAPTNSSNNNSNNANSTDDKDEEAKFAVAIVAKNDSGTRAYEDAEGDSGISKESPFSAPQTAKRTGSSQLSHGSTKASLFANASLTQIDPTTSSTGQRINSTSTLSNDAASVSISLPSSSNSSRVTEEVIDGGHVRASSDVSRKRLKKEDAVSSAGSGTTLKNVPSEDLALVDEEMRMIAMETASMETASVSTGYHSDKSTSRSTMQNGKHSSTTKVRRSNPKNRQKQEVTDRRSSARSSLWATCANGTEGVANGQKGRKSIKGARTSKASLTRIKTTLSLSESEQLENEILQMTE